jgi:hypothetical protein
MPPQNGFGLGAAFVAARNTQNWRMSWDVDAVGAFSGAWRAGGYMTLIHTPAETIHVIVPTAAGSEAQSAKAKKPTLAVHPYTVFNLYAQTISLNKLNYFGLGNDSPLAGKSVFGMTQTIVGVNAIKPVYEWAAIRKLCRYSGREWAIRPFDRDAVHQRDRAGISQPARICPVRRGPSHQASDCGLRAAQLHGKV